jgi:uncharacterized protein YndB with AHSA1/START domain
VSIMSAFVVSRLVRTDPHTAFDAWTKVEQLKQWWWPQWPDTTFELDVQQGGAYTIRSAQGDAAVSGGYSEVRPGHVLTFGWQWEGDPSDADTVTVLFTPDAQGLTEVTVVHVSPGRPINPDNQRGWNDVLQRLPDSSAA